ncbi:hypothetical protein FRC17_002494 [Serendipita sp. 399]|nr:hypothetical protein FRC17_002494 [Serendipita sp. 399]
MSVLLTSQSCALVVIEPKQSNLIPTNIRTIDRLASSLGSAADELARRLGWGLQNATKRIQDNLVTLSYDEKCKMDREMLLRRLRDAFNGGDRLPQLAKACHRLMKYTLPKETAQTQLGAFRKLVMFTTNYPGMRHFFLSFKGLDQAEDTKVAVERMWARKLAKNNPYRREWKFFHRFAMSCILGGTVAPVVEKCPINEMGVVWKRGEYGILDDLLLVWSSCEFYEISGLVAMRYIGGILQLPTFWLQANYSHHQEFTQKLFRRLRKCLEDIGFGREGPLGSTEHVSDIEGIDILAHTALEGINKWSHDSSGDLNTECWFGEFRKVISLLLTPEARRFLRNSSIQAITLFADIIENREYPSISLSSDHTSNDNGNSSYGPPLADPEAFTSENRVPEPQPRPWPQSIDEPDKPAGEYPEGRLMDGDSIEEGVPFTPNGEAAKHPDSSIPGDRVSDSNETMPIQLAELTLDIREDDTQTIRTAADPWHLVHQRWFGPVAEDQFPALGDVQRRKEDLIHRTYADVIKGRAPTTRLSPRSPAPSAHTVSSRLHSSAAGSLSYNASSKNRSRQAARIQLRNSSLLPPLPYISRLRGIYAPRKPNLNSKPVPSSTRTYQQDFWQRQAGLVTKVVESGRGGLRSGSSIGGGLGVLLGNSRFGGGGRAIEEDMEAAIDLYGLNTDEVIDYLNRFLIGLEAERFLGLAYALVDMDAHIGMGNLDAAYRQFSKGTVSEWLTRKGYAWREWDGTILCIDCQRY